MKFLAKIKAVAGATACAFGETMVHADMLVEEVSLSPKVPKIIGYANIAANSAARTANIAVMAKPRNKRAWQAAIIFNVMGCATTLLCRAYDKENYEAATLRYVGRCLETGDEFANRIIAVKEAA